jgi:hypothetical protein
MLNITDKAFQYVPSFSTDIAKRFKEIIEKQRLLEARTALEDGRLSPGFAMAMPIA